MPVKTKKTKCGYSNSTPGGSKGKCMTKKNAAAQKRLLNAADHGFVPSHEKMKKRVMGE
jgi:hypothetical protein